MPDGPHAEFQRIIEARVYRPNQTILRQGDDAHGVFNVRSGTVLLTHLTHCGKEGTVRLVSAAGVLGLTEVTVGARFQYGARALETCTLEYAPRKAFVSFLLDHPPVAVELLIWLSREFDKLQLDLCETTARPDLAARLLRKLRELGEICGHSTAEGLELNPLFTGQDLADCLGCSRQWVSKLMGDLEHRGLIKRRTRRIVVTTAALAAGDGHRPQAAASFRGSSVAG